MTTNTYYSLEQSLPKEIPSDDPSWLQPYINKKYIRAAVTGDTEKIMDKLGVGFMHKHVLKYFKPICTLEFMEGKKYNFKVSHFRYKYDFIFEIGEEFVKTKMDGKEVHGIVYQDKNVLTQMEVWEDKNGVVKTLTTIRGFTDDKIICSHCVDDLADRVIYNLIE